MIKLLYRFLFFMLAILFLALAQKFFCAFLAHKSAGADFTGYWTSGRLLIGGQNPYLSDSILALQTSVGRTSNNPFVMYSPPWLLTFILPFSIKNYMLAKFLWLLFVFICTLISLLWLWQFYGGKKEDLYWTLFILLAYPPIYFALVQGQIVPLILLGIVGFLHFARKNQWFLAGVFACLLGIKPHVTYLLLLALFVWAIYNKQWNFIFGAGCTTFLITTIPLLYNPDTLHQYYKEVVVHSFQYHWDTPTLGNLLRSLLGKEKHFLQNAPLILGIVWFFYHWYHNCEKWVWAQQVPLLLFMSLMTTFYLWVNDYVLLLVGIIQASIWLIYNHMRRYSKLMIFVYLIINLIAWVTTFAARSQKMFVWMVPALFITYLLVKIFSMKSNEKAGIDLV